MKYSLKKQNTRKPGSDQTSRSNYLFIFTENTGYRRIYQVTPQVYYQQNRSSFFNKLQLGEGVEGGRMEEKLID